MKTSVSVRKPRSGFTLIELLIVIGLLGALALLVLPALMADRETALANVCDYNQAGTLKVLNQFEQLTGKIPNGLHSGLQDPTSALPMQGLPAALLVNVNRSGTIQPLTADEATALQNIGLQQIAYGAGDKTATTEADRLGYEAPAASQNVICCTTDWQDDGGELYSFDGKSVSVYESEGVTKVVALFITPTTDWEAKEGNNRWVQGVSLGMDIEGKCPIPNSDFAYYIAYVGVTGSYADYTAGTFQVGTGTPGSPAIPAPTSTRGATTAILEAAIDAAISATTNWTAGTWADGTVANTRVMTASYDDSSGNTGSVQYTVTDHPNASPSAELLGTSCPECGVINP